MLSNLLHEKTSKGIRREARLLPGAIGVILLLSLVVLNPLQAHASNAWTGWFPTPSGSISTNSSQSEVVYQSATFVFAQRSDNTIWYKTSSVFGWSPWQVVPGGGLTFSAPSAVVYGSTLMLFVQGTDNAVWLATYNTSGWSGWVRQTGPFDPNGIPTASSPGTVIYQGFLYLFLRQSDNTLDYDSFGGSFWTGLKVVPHNGLTPSAPSAVVFGNFLELYIQGTDNNVYEIPFSNGSFGQGWFSQGILTASSPAIIVFQASLYMFIRQSDDTIDYVIYSGGCCWGPVVPVPGNGMTPSAPSAIAFGDSSLEVFVRGEENNVWLNDYAQVLT